MKKNLIPIVELFYNKNLSSLLALVHPENQLNAFLMYSAVDAWRVVELQANQAGGYGEFLLVFQTLSIYVDIQGRKSRDREIMYPAVPTHISTNLNLSFESYLVQRLMFFFFNSSLL